MSRNTYIIYCDSTSFSSILSSISPIISRIQVNDKVFDFSKPFDPKKPYQQEIPAPADGENTTVVVDAPNASWTITGKFAVILQDLRKWNADILQLRLMFTPYSGMITNASLDFSLVLNPKSE